MVAGLLFAMACANAAEPVSIQNASNTNASRSGPAAADDHHDEDNAPRITLADAKKAFDAGEAVFIDTRDPNNFKQEHIKGAMNVTTAMLASQYESIPKDKKIIAYCS